MKVINIVLCVLFIIFSEGVFACNGSADFDNNETVQFNDVIVQRDAAVGTVIASSSGTLTGGYHYAADSCDMYAVMKYNGAKPSSIADVYDTNIPGVGIRVKMSFNNGSGYASAAPGTFLLHLQSGNYSFYPPSVELIKTGSIESGSLSVEDVATLQPGTDVTAKSTVTWKMATPAKVTQVACSITSGGTLAFPMGNIEANEIMSPGISSSSEVSENIRLNCNSGANINVTLDGTKNPDMDDDSILALSNQGSAGVANGVGVQLLFNNVPVKINSLMNLKKSSGGDEQLSVIARYVKTKEPVKPGIANATATINLIYQ